MSVDVRRNIRNALRFDLFSVVMMFLRYDSKTDTWTIVAPINSPRDAVGVCVLGDKLYAVGGYDGSMYRHDVEAYDPQTNEWTKVSHITTRSVV